MDTKLQTRILRKSEIRPSGCREWVGSVGGSGYGNINVSGKTTTASRAAYIAFVGPVPEGCEVDHLCRNRLCVNPDHLEAVTHAENCLRQPSMKARVESVHCVHGHVIDGVRTRDGGGRYCKTCVKLNKRRQRSKT